MYHTGWLYHKFYCFHDNIGKFWFVEVVKVEFTISCTREVINRGRANPQIYKIIIYMKTVLGKTNYWRSKIDTTDERGCIFHVV